MTGSKGFSSFSHPTTGVYCLTLASGVQLKTAPLVSIEWGASLGVVLFAQWNSDNTTCGAATNVIEVRTYKGDTAGVGSSYQIPVLSDRVAFVVLVPNRFSRTYSGLAQPTVSLAVGKAMRRPDLGSYSGTSRFS